MKVGSLFAGIGGFDLAASWLGWQTKWYSEIDPYASAVMAKHFPLAENHGDITKIDGHAIEHVDLLCGGFPCQDISLAGKGAGLSGARSGLWSHYARLIDEIRPSWVVIENVSALRSRGLDVVLGEVAALGYDAEWHCIPASAVGAPHRRDRVWITCHTDDGRKPDDAFDAKASGLSHVAGRTTSDAVGQFVRIEPRRRRGARWPDTSLFAVNGEARDVADSGVEREREQEYARAPLALGRNARLESGGSGERFACGNTEPELADAVCAGLEGQWEVAGRTTTEFRDASVAGWWESEPDVGRVANGIPSRVDRLKCLGNAIVPQVAYEIFKAIERAELDAVAHLL